MSRKLKARDISGWLIIDKPKGLTSASVVNKVKWALDAKKAGHAGTLDPNATGVLAIALGEATKTVPYVTNSLKCYEFTVRLGVATSTDDDEGQVISESSIRPTNEQIQEALGRFIGDIEQYPPKFSAVKINGERAYALARQGKVFALSSRPLYVKNLLMLKRPDRDHVELEIICGKGGYVRSIARDIGKTLRCYGHVQRLRRTWSGPFDNAHCIDFELVDQLAKTSKLQHYIYPLERGLAGLPKLECPSESVQKLRNGNPASVVAGDADYGDTCWASYQDEPIAIGEYRSGYLHPIRVFLPTTYKKIQKTQILNLRTHPKYMK